VSAHTKTCRVCGQDRDLRDFRTVGRGYSGTCMPCERAPAAEAPAAEEPAAEPNLLLEIRPGYELRVWVDGDGDLVLAQGESRIYLAPHQVPQLAQFLNPVKEATP
jgi:hypothetical protein